VSVIDPNVTKNLSLLVTTTLSKMDVDQQMIFAEELNKRKKSLFTAYLLCIFLTPFVFLYVRRVWLMFVFIVVSVVTFGVGGVIWFIVELFIIPHRVRSCNNEVAIGILKDQSLLDNVNYNTIP